jgi:hypothetical protein
MSTPEPLTVIVPLGAVIAGGFTDVMVQADAASIKEKSRKIPKNTGIKYHNLLGFSLRFSNSLSIF